MYKFCILLSVLAMAVSCKESKKKFDSVVDFEQIKIESNGKRDLDSIYNVAITWDKPVAAPPYLNDSIMKYTKLLLAAWFNVADDRD
ncbi:MAG: hypothetical protein LBQ70_06690, partial [Prevotellaceae bacterium]|nr:hypothetical protein [Prevotellaceae bacterium]